MKNENCSEYFFLNEEKTARVQFKINDKSQSRHFGIYYYSKKYPQNNSLGTVYADLYKDKRRRGEVQKTIEVIYNLCNGDEKLFKELCKSIFAKRGLRTEVLNEKLTPDEEVALKEFLKEYREENGDQI